MLHRLPYGNGPNNQRKDRKRSEGHQDTRMNTKDGLNYSLLGCRYENQDHDDQWYRNRHDLDGRLFHSKHLPTRDRWERYKSCVAGGTRMGVLIAESLHQ